MKHDRTIAKSCDVTSVRGGEEGGDLEQGRRSKRAQHGKAGSLSRAWRHARALSSGSLLVAAAREASQQTSEGDSDPDAYVVHVFDARFVGISEEAIASNERSQFQINHSAHLCLLLLPGINLIWFPIYLLHCAGCLQWF